MASAALDLFLELAAMPSPSGHERAVADRVLAYLHDLRLSPTEDSTGAALGSTMGNIHVALEPTAPGEPLFLCAHLDTVPANDAIEPVIVDGVVRNANRTILGSDNKAAVAVMLDAVRTVLAENRPHAGIELLFTYLEETGLHGAYAFDHSRLRAKTGYVYDQAGPIGEVILGAPSAQQLEFVFHGRSAHAGMAPEDGRSAIAAAARAIAEMPLGRVNDETTANVGLISGGNALNIVPEWCSFSAEARSHDEAKLSDQIQAMQDAATFAAGVADCDVETSVKRSYRCYRFRPADLVVRIATQALEQCGYTTSFALSGGAADANAFNEHGLQCLNLSNGMAEIHTPDEHIAVADIDGMVDVTLALFDAARAT